MKLGCPRAQLIAELYFCSAHQLGAGSGSSWGHGSAVLAPPLLPPQAEVWMESSLMTRGPLTLV